MESSGVVIDAIWVVIAALNFLLFVGAIVLVVGVVRWVRGARRRDSELAALSARVAAIENRKDHDNQGSPDPEDR